MNNEEKILELLQIMQSDISGLKTSYSGLEQRFDSLEQKVNDMDEVLTKTALRQETMVIPKLQVLYENQVTLIQTTAKKEDVDALREDLGLQKYRIDVITDKLRHG